MRAELLDVVCVYANPMRWDSRVRLHTAFEEHMLDSGVRLTTVEVAYGDRPYVLEERAGVNRVYVRTNSLVWIKESAINIGISRLPEDWRYLAWLDGDIRYRKHGWAAEAVHALQLFDIIQPWEHCYDLGPNDEHIKVHHSFCRQWHRDPICCRKMGKGYCFAHPGYGWAANRAAIDRLGGLFEFGALGAADHHMSHALIGQAHLSLPGNIHPNYAKHVHLWQDRAMKHVNGNIGFIPYTIEHGFHGRPKKRKYVERWDTLVKHQYDPDRDVKRNTFGLLELAGNKPALARDIYRYFSQRNEDDNALD